MNRTEAARRLLIECQRLKLPVKLRGEITTHLAGYRSRGRPRRIDRLRLAELLVGGSTQQAAADVLGCSISAVRLVVAEWKAAHSDGGRNSVI